MKIEFSWGLWMYNFFILFKINSKITFHLFGANTDYFQAIQNCTRRIFESKYFDYYSLPQYPSSQISRLETTFIETLRYEIKPHFILSHLAGTIVNKL